MPDSINHNPLPEGDQVAQRRRARSDEPAPEASTTARGRVGAMRRLDGIDLALHHWLVAHSMAILRVSLGVVFLCFGFLKFFPGISPAENLTATTTSILTFGLVPASVALVAIATLECVIGIWLLVGRALRGVIYLLFVELVGILSPIPLLAGRLFMGPHNAPTLEGQYVLKDVIIVGAVLVLGATLRGGRLTSRQPRRRRGTAAAPDRINRTVTANERES